MDIHIDNKKYFKDGSDEVKDSYYAVFDKKQGKYAGYYQYHYGNNLVYSDIPLQTHKDVYDIKEFIFNHQSEDTDLVIHEFALCITRTKNDVYNNYNDKILNQVRIHACDYNFYYKKFAAFIEDELSSNNRYFVFVEIDTLNTKNNLKDIKKILSCKNHKAVGYHKTADRNLYGLWTNDLKFVVLTKLVKNNEGQLFVYDSHLKKIVQDTE